MWVQKDDSGVGGHGKIGPGGGGFGEGSLGANGSRKGILGKSRLREEILEGDITRKYSSSKVNYLKKNSLEQKDSETNNLEKFDS